MDPSVLSTAARSLESSSDSLSAWLFFFTSLVVIGLVVEYWHVFWGLLTRRKIEPKHRQEVIGGILITLGVAGELLVQPLENRVEHKLRSASHLIEASLIKSSEDSRAKAKDFERGIAASNQSAASARLDAAKANERVATANAKAEGLRAAIETSKTEQARLALTTEALRKENIAAAERLEAEKAERLKMERYLAPRDIGEQYSFGQALSRYQGVKVFVTAMGDVECQRLAETLLFSLKAVARWDIQRIPLSDEQVILGGVVIEYSTNLLSGNNVPQSAAKALELMLNSRNISAVAIPLPGESPRLRITIGLKPSPEEIRHLNEMRERMEEATGLRRPPLKN